MTCWLHRIALTFYNCNDILNVFAYYALTALFPPGWQMLSLPQIFVMYAMMMIQLLVQQK